MGRVTNPVLQRPRAVIDFLPQVWNLEGRVTGRDLGPDKFQLRFESESDLIAVLNKGPYHYKKWMIILQRWEPVVSEGFPSTISFWIRVHDLPLHYWNDKTLETIAEQLGVVAGKIHDDARIRIEMNGMQPLMMSLEIQLPSDEITTVEFEYLKIEKHCFTCFSFFHEETDCPSRTRNLLPPKERKLGITQRLALQRIGADKRRHDDRRGYTRPNMARNREVSDGREHRSLSIRNSSSSHQEQCNTADRSQRFSGLPERDQREARYRTVMRSHYHNEEDGTSRELASGKVLSTRETPPSSRVSLGDNTSTRIGSQISHTPPSRTLRDRLEFPNEQSSERTLSNSNERRSALLRIAEPDRRKAPTLGDSNGRDGNRVQSMEAPTASPNLHIQSREHDGTGGSASGPRVPASLRIQEPPEPQEPLDQFDSVNISVPQSLGKATGKRKTTRTTVRRVARSPLKGILLSKAGQARASKPPRKKLCTDREYTASRSIVGAGIIPRSSTTRSQNKRRKEGQDFHPPPPPLP